MLMLASALFILYANVIQCVVYALFCLHQMLMLSSALFTLYANVSQCIIYAYPRSDSEGLIYALLSAQLSA